ncbi:uncharacterized protein [Littorina saxatilis]
MVETLARMDQLHCDCPSNCREHKFEIQMSQVPWPTQIYERRTDKNRDIPGSHSTCLDEGGERRHVAATADADRGLIGAYCGCFHGNRSGNSMADMSTILSMRQSGLERTSRGQAGAGHDHGVLSRV